MQTPVSGDPSAYVGGEERSHGGEPRTETEGCQQEWEDSRGGQVSDNGEGCLRWHRSLTPRHSGNERYPLAAVVAEARMPRWSGMGEVRGQADPVEERSIRVPHERCGGGEDVLDPGLALDCQRLLEHRIQRKHRAALRIVHVIEVMELPEDLKLAATSRVMRDLE